MNFKIILLLTLLCSCGVKGDPVTPEDPAFPSLLENYPDIETDKKLDETKRR